MPGQDTHEREVAMRNWVWISLVATIVYMVLAVILIWIPSLTVRLLIISGTIVFLYVLYHYPSYWYRRMSEFCIGLAIGPFLAQGISLVVHVNKDSYAEFVIDNKWYVSLSLVLLGGVFGVLDYMSNQRSKRGGITGDILKSGDQVNTGNRITQGGQAITVLHSGKGDVVIHQPQTGNPPDTGEIESKTDDLIVYLEWLKNDCQYINVRGLQVGSDRANRMPIDEFFIPLSTVNTERQRDYMAGGSGRDDSDDIVSARHDMATSQRIDLHQAIQNDRLVIIGDPGSGKTTFLRKVAFEMCNQYLDHAGGNRSEPTGRSIPILINIGELISYENKDCKDMPRFMNGPAWITHFAAWKSKEFKAELSEAYFEQILKRGTATVLIDGLDEATDNTKRAQIVQMVEAASKAYKDCRFVVTSRPAAYREEAVLNEFEHARIEPLDDEVIEGFLHKWAYLQFQNDKRSAEKYYVELCDAVQSREEIRRLARNAVMLTALAVIHWNEKRLPDQRVELYESIIKWLARSREQYPGRTKDKQCIEYLQALAYAMQSHTDGRQVQVRRYAAAEAIAGKWHDKDRSEAIRQAEQFLEEEERDSGIVVARGKYIRFWHLTFQEYLAARALAGLENERNALLASDSIYKPEWREVMLLLAGVLCNQTNERAESMFTAVLDQLGENAGLAGQAECFGLLGAAARDLASYGFQPSDSRYLEMRDAVMGIFDREKSKNVTIEEAIKAAEVLGQSGDPRFDGRLKNPHMVELKGGEFRRGNGRYRVALKPYLIGQYPITVEQFNLFVKAGGYGKEQYWTEGGFNYKWSQPEGWEEQKRYPSRPVVGVSWYEAMAYCAWLRESTSKEYRLLTEAEWEFAAGGEEGRKYAWGNESTDKGRLNYDENVNAPTPVGIYPLGSTPDNEIHDLSGNVWEWCRDWYGDYPETDMENPEGPERGSGRVLRGGSWGIDALNCRCAVRDWFHPDFRIGFVGFRVALDIP